MSHGEFSQSDSSYPANFLWTLERTKTWLQDGKDDTGLVNFGRFLHDMKNRSEFQPPHCSHQPEPMVLGGRMEYREPMWKLAHEVASKHSPTCAMSQEECAEWLWNLLELAGRYFFMKSVLAEFEKKLLGKKINVAINSMSSSAALWVRTDPATSGQNAMALIDTIIAELLPKVEAHIEKAASRPA